MTISTPILVTGGTGFLGRHVVSVLGARGARVRVLSRSTPDPAEGPALPAALEHVAGSVLDPEVVARALEGVTHVIHLAGRVSYGRGDSELFALHVTGTRTVLEAARAQGVTRCVYVSTSGAVGLSEDLDHVADAGSPFALEAAQRFPYYLSKIFAEKEALEIAARGLEVMVISPSLLLGPGDLRGSSSTLVTRYLRREISAVPPGIAAIVDVRDAAAACVAALDQGAPGTRYLLGHNASFQDVFAILKEVSGVAAPWASVPKGVFARVTRALSALEDVAGLGARGKELAMAGYSWAVDDAEARADLGFEPRALRETLRDAVEDLRARGVVDAGEGDETAAAQALERADRADADGPSEDALQALAAFAPDADDADDTGPDRGPADDAPARPDPIGALKRLLGR